MKESLQGKIVVITGASSGIGRATAAEFAKQGANVVLAGRDADALSEAEAECKGYGANAMTVTTDVTQENQVEELAGKAEEAFGKLDIWVNNAGVALFAKFDETPTDDYRRVMDTDFFGYVYGARAALKRFKNQGYGTIINIDSVEGIAPKPYNSAYAAAKHAVRALASSLRMELALDNLSGINVCTVIPATADTPLYAHAGNYTGRGVRAPETAVAPAQVAQAITKVALKPQREVLVGNVARSAMQYLFSPQAYERKEAFGYDKRHLTADQVSKDQGNLFRSSGPHAVSGGWRTRQQKAARPWLPLAIIGGAIVGLTGIAAIAALATAKTRGAGEPGGTRKPEKPRDRWQPRFKNRGFAIMPISTK
jgi:NAD(P)-dependent dehydrogenase (short-subunit alcohol dehydrogenase family)